MNPLYVTDQLRQPARTWGPSLLLSLGMACLIGAGAQASFRLWFTDVPVTLQVFFVLLAGGLLGFPWGAVSVLEYLAMGAMGLPVFSEGQFGPQVLLGPTGGYLLAFVLAAALIGYVTDRGKNRWLIGAAMIVSVLLILLCGGVWRWLMFGHSWSAVFGLAVLPFLAEDVLKAVVAWSIVVKARQSFLSSKGVQ